MKVLDVDGLKRVVQNVSDKIAEEADARKDADTSLGNRIGSVETDLTGIKELTYGTEASKLVDVADGSYCSPALDKIQQDISDLQATSGMTVIEYTGTSSYAKVNELWPNVILYDWKIDGYLFPAAVADYADDDHLYVFSEIGVIGSNDKGYTSETIQLSSILSSRITNNLASPNSIMWSNIQNKPFSYIGSGLKVVSNAITVNTATNDDIDAIFTDVLG